MGTIDTRLELGYFWEAFLRIQKSESIFFDSQLDPSHHFFLAIQVAFAVLPFESEEAEKVAWAFARSLLFAGYWGRLSEGWTSIHRRILICPQWLRA